MQEVFKILRESSEKVLLVKAKEYSSSVSRFHNFEVASELTGMSSEVCLLMMMSKHIASVYDILEKCEPITRECFIEKFGDAYNYSLLLLAMVTNIEDPTFFNDMIAVDLTKFKRDKSLTDSFRDLFNFMSKKIDKSHANINYKIWSKLDIILEIKNFILTLIDTGNSVILGESK